MTKSTAQPPRTVGDERRAHPRLRRQVEVRGAEPHAGDEARMVTTDLSLGGLHCVSSADFAEMTRLAVRLMLPTPAGAQEPVDVEAVVVRREAIGSDTARPRFELALFFTRVGDEARDRLATFLSA